MRFTPTDNFNLITNAAFKTLAWIPYVKVSTTASESIDNGAWIDVSNYVAQDSIGTKSQIEYELGQFSIDSKSVTAVDINYWKTNIFTASNLSDATKYIEMKFMVYLSMLSLNSETIGTFSGFVDKTTIKYNEDGDAVTFLVMTLDNNLVKIPGETYNTQPFTTSSGVTGVFLANIPGVIVTNVSCSSATSNTILDKGVHTLKCNYNSEEFISFTLDNGAPIYESFISTSIDIIDLLPPYLIYSSSVNYSYIPTMSIIIADEFHKSMSIFVESSSLSMGSTSQDILITDDTIYPKVWYQNIWIYKALKDLYVAGGVVDFTFDDFKLRTYDGRQIFSFLEIPIGDSYYGKPSAISHDATNNLFWIGIQDRIYTFDSTTHLYVYINTVPTGYVIVRLWAEDSATGFIWAVARDAAGAHKIIRIIISTSALTSYTITRTNTTAGGEKNFAISLSTVRNIYYLSTTLGECAFDLTTLTEYNNSVTIIYAQSFPGVCDEDGNYYYQNESNPGRFQRVKYSAGFVADYIDTDIPNEVVNAVYSLTLQLWFGCAYTTSGWRLFCWDTSGTTTSILATQTSGGSVPAWVDLVADEGVGWIYCLNITSDPLPVATSFARTNGDIYELTGDIIPIGYNFDNAYSSHVCYDTIGNRLVGFLNPTGILFQYCTYATMYIGSELVGTSKTYFDMIGAILKAYNLIANMRFDKSVYVFRRGDDFGTPISQSNNLTVTTNEVTDVHVDIVKYAAVDYVTVSNNTDSITFNDFGFNVYKLSSQRILELSNELLPTNILKDIAYYLYQFYRTDKILYTVTCNTSPFQYEPFDGCILSLTGNKIPIAGSGIVMAAGNDEFGDVTLDVLVNAPDPNAGKYWVGGSGDWSDTYHWSNSSGGIGGASIPTSGDNVYINSYSGLDSGGTITLGAAAFCKDFATAVGNNYTIVGKGEYLSISGNSSIESGLTFVESYSEINQNSGYNIYSSAKVAQTFKGNGSTITSCSFYMSRYGDDILGDSTFYAYLYESSGSYGANSIPTTTMLNITDGVNGTTIQNTGYQLVNFVFSTPYALVHGTPYEIVTGLSDGSYLGYLIVGAEVPSVAEIGNAATTPAAGPWTPNAATVLCYYIYGVTP
jgi:hypothetical protein